MARTYREETFEDGKVIERVDAPFDTAIEALRKKGIEYPMSTPELANARQLVPLNHSLNENGSYTSEGFLYVKNSPVLVARISPLLKDNVLVRFAVDANRKRNYFSTEDTRLYEENAKIAEDDKSKSPIERKVIQLLSRNNFTISPTENPEAFEFFFGKDGQKYLSHIGRNSITVYPVATGTVDAQKGTLLTQSWLRGLVSGSDVGGGGLYGGNHVRGVRLVEAGEAREQKNSDIRSEAKVESYTPKQLARALKDLKIAGLEETILKQLRQN